MMALALAPGEDQPGRRRRPGRRGARRRQCQPRVAAHRGGAQRAGAARRPGGPRRDRLPAQCRPSPLLPRHHPVHHAVPVPDVHRRDPALPDPPGGGRRGPDLRRRPRFPHPTAASRSSSSTTRAAWPPCRSSRPATPRSGAKTSAAANPAAPAARPRHPRPPPAAPPRAAVAAAPSVTRAQRTPRSPRRLQVPTSRAEFAWLISSRLIGGLSCTHQPPAALALTQTEPPARPAG